MIRKLLTALVLPRVIAFVGRRLTGHVTAPSRHRR
jgi:hypothetical protein